MDAIKRNLKELFNYPSAVIGLSLILGLVVLSAYAMISIPYDEAVDLWRGSDNVWYANPRNVPPAWTNLFSKKRLPTTLLIGVSDEAVTREEKVSSAGFKDITYTYTFDFDYDDFYQEISVFFTTEYEEKQPFASIVWITPDGREIRVGDFALGREESIRFSQDDRLTRRLGRIPANFGLMLDPEKIPEPDPVDESEVDPDLAIPQIEYVPLKGTYQMRISILTFEENSDVIEAELVAHGLVHGIAGTDHLRRDLKVALLWGTPIALSFGLLASVGISVLTIIIAAIGVWFGGIVDGTIQRLTEINLVLPFLSILIMIGAFYSRSLWVILGATIALSIFGTGIKQYRAIFLQVKESTYIEAAQAYGASNMRIIFMYMIPRIVPLLVPTLVLSVPSFVFLEATLASLGLGDPVLPTWGKLIRDAVQNAAIFRGQYYWMLQPAALLMITGISFAMVGYSLDRIFNPRLRSQD